jgi:hypothetical protein
MQRSPQCGWPRAATERAGQQPQPPCGSSWIPTCCFDPLPDVTGSPDPDDDFLLALAKVSDADVLVTGDKSHLLVLRRSGRTRIRTARELVEELRI